jgi:glycerol-3-phosphate dehydrogenase
MAFDFLDETLRVTWMRRYGMRALELAEYTQAQAGGRERLPGVEPILFGEVKFACEREWAKTPIDFLRRRTDIYFTRSGGIESLDSIQKILQQKYPMAQKALSQDFDYLAFLKRNRHHAVSR